jgi:hypothetical protein
MLLSFILPLLYETAVAREASSSPGSVAMADPLLSGSMNWPQFCGNLTPNAIILQTADHRFGPYLRRH